MKYIRFSFSDYKCFKGETVFEAPSLVNLIIGRNNSGKTSLADFFENVFFERKLGGYYPIPNAKVICSPTQDDAGFIKYRVPSRPFATTNLNDLSPEELDGAELCFHLSFSKSGGYAFIQKESVFPSFSDAEKTVSIGDTSLLIENSNRKYKLFRLSADRNVEQENPASLMDLRRDGSGLTSLLAFQSNNKKGNRKLIDSLLRDINEILRGEEEFEKLLLLSNENGLSEITLVDHGEEIPLSQMGNGLKTIILVLYCLQSASFSDDQYGFIFEELENNLHPEIQRRLFCKIYRYAIEHKTPVFITSHSHVAINSFYGKPETKIYHLKKQFDKGSSIEVVDTHLAKVEILDDLGVKASDIFQSNGIIWVEGPSDRAYLNKWLPIVAPDLHEYEHFTYLYYGGKLLSHYSAEEETNVISILLTNRNAAIVMDSDIKDPNGEINSTKKRIQSEFNDKKAFCWVTAGREIENYIHKDSINARYSKHVYEQIGKYEDFKDYIMGDDDRFESHKVAFAESLSFDNSHLAVMDLRERVNSLAKTIREWNHLPNPHEKGK